MSADRPDDPIFKLYPRLTPDELLEHVQSRVRQRTKLLWSVYAEHAADWSGVYLNRRVLAAAVESYYCDVYRVKFFRPVKWVDDHKKAAFTMKWIARSRPIQIHSGAKLSKSVLMANAWYAAIAGLYLLGVSAEWQTDPWWVNYTRNLAYLLHYHSPSVEQLSSEMFVLQTLDKARSPR